MVKRCYLCIQSSGEIDITEMDSCKILREVEHYHKKLKKNIERNETDRISYCLYKLNNLDIELEHLFDTKIGRTVNKLIKNSGDIGEDAYNLIYKWKKILADEQNETIEDMETKNITIIVKRKRTNDHSDEVHVHKKTNYSSESAASSPNNNNTSACQDNNKESRKLAPIDDNAEVDNFSGKSFEDVMSGMLPSEKDMKQKKKSKKFSDEKKEKSKISPSSKKLKLKNSDVKSLKGLPAPLPLPMDEFNLSDGDLVKKLSKLTVNELMCAEYNNPTLLTKTKSLWKSHCKKQFPDKERRKDESWKQLYLSCLSAEANKNKTA